jgi:hypothetical protein
MSKGSKRRPEDNDKYREGYDAIFSATAKVYKSGRRYIPEEFHVKPMPVVHYNIGKDTLKEVSDFYCKLIQDKNGQANR